MIIKKIALIGSFSALLIWLGYFTNRQDFKQLFGLYSALFLVYYLLVYTLKNAREILFTGIFFRLLLLFAIPALSDDFYRFIWDGKLLINGINPYLFTPKELMQSADFQEIFVDKNIFEKLNSPQYYSVYPPLNQLIFAASAYFSNGQLWNNILALKIFILIAEIGTLILLFLEITKFSGEEKPLLIRATDVELTGRSLNPKSSKLIALYVFNPLIVIELSGNLHFEAWIVFFLLVAFYFLSAQTKITLKQLAMSAFLFACAVNIKMFPLMLLPLIFNILGFKKGFYYAVLVGFFTIMFFLPFIEKRIIENIFSSVSLYFQKFEFNASIYYVLRAIGYQTNGYNMIAFFGKILAFISFISIIFIATKTKDIYAGTLATFTIYFLLATTVHPWYISTLVAMAVFSRFRYAFVWSYVVFLSYAAYQTNTYQENLYLVFTEYLIVFVFLFTEKRHKLKKA